MSSSRWRWVVGLLVLAWLPVTAQGGLTPGNVFTADYSSLAGNWSFQHAPANGTRTRQLRLAGGGPNGRDALELSQIPATQLSSCGGQSDWGHVASLSNYPAGVSRFYRARIFVTAETNFRAAAWQGGCGATRTRNKYLIVGQDGQRMIMNLEGFRDGNPTFEFIFDGWPNSPPETTAFTRGVWHSWQLEIRFGNASTAYLKLWVDRDVYAQPSITLTGFAATESQNGNTHFGAFTNDGLQSDGVFVHRHADFRVATTFDAAWHAGLTGGLSAPGAATSVRVIR